MKELYVVYTDGGARGNPGPAGVGVVVQNEKGDIVKEVSKFLGRRTNNWAEYEAVIVGFETLKKLLGPKTKNYSVEFRLDSELIARQLSNHYQVKEETLFPQFVKAHNFMVKDFPQVRFVHVSREKNKHADKLANRAMDDGR